MQYLIKGRVTKGEGYGRKIGFPTANLDRLSFSKLKIKPKLGVYAGNVEVDGKIYRSGIVIGPIDKKGLPKIEAHLIEFNKNIYVQEVILSLNKFIRKFINFKDEKSLIAQIKKDLKQC